jgi:hypothetical protein
VVRGSTATGMPLVPLIALNATLMNSATTSVFGWFVSWISSVDILDFSAAHVLAVQ